MSGSIEEFVRQSNLIEGITREPTEDEVMATVAFISFPVITIGLIKNLVSVYQPDARLRNIPGLNVMVGRHMCPPGGPMIEENLEALLESLPNLTSFEAHVRYEHLHPFTDGNGRSGRALWLWMMQNNNEWIAPGGFLQTFYYQTLDRLQSDARFQVG